MALIIKSWELNIWVVGDCACNAEGSRDLNCDVQTGQCDCNCAIEGINCDTCTDMHYNFPECEGNRKICKIIYWLKRKLWFAH